jgi:serine/threonine protein kinase
MSTAQMTEPLVAGDATEIIDTVHIALGKSISQSTVTLAEHLHARGLNDTEGFGGRNARYQVGRLVARGGMGLIYQLKDCNVHRDVAVKVMLANLQDAEEQIMRFVQEAQITGQLEHPNIVPVHELGVSETDTIYYTMKYLKGKTLQEVLDGIKRGDQEIIERMPLDNLLTVFEKVCDAIAFAHSRGVVHRDIKPQNIMIGDFGEVLVLDWGLAKILPGFDSSPVLTPIANFGGDDQPEVDPETSMLKTMQGRIMGTPAFIAPEQVREELGVRDGRLDVYALGAVLYQILTLEIPFGGRLKEILADKMQGNLPPPHEHEEPCPHCPNDRVPESISAVCLKAMAVMPHNRYPSVAALQHDIQAYRTGHATQAEEAGALRHIFLMFRRNRSHVLLMILSSLIIALILAISANGLYDARQQSNDALARAVDLDRELALLRNARRDRQQKGETVAPITAPSAAPENPFAVFAGLRDVLLRDNPGLAILSFKPKLTLEGMGLDLSNNAGLRNISALKGLALGELHLDHTAVADLSPLAGMPLAFLSVSHTSIRELSALENLPLYFVDLSHTDVSDLSALVGENLAYLNLENAPITSVRPLLEAPNLRGLVVADSCPDIDSLRVKAGLAFLSHSRFDENAAVFWAQRDARQAE